MSAPFQNEQHTTTMNSTQASSSTSYTSRPTSLSTLSPVFDQSSPSLITAGTIGYGLAGGAVGGVYGFSKHVNPFEIGMRMGRNWTIGAGTFFGLREFVVSPILTGLQLTRFHEHRYAELSERQFGKLPPRRITEIFGDNILDTAIAGGIGGGIITAFSSDARGTKLIRAGCTASVLVTLLQLSVNSLRIARLTYLSRSSAPTPAPEPGPERPGTLKQIARSFRTRKSDEDLEAAGETSIHARIANAMTKFLPVTKFSDEEYVATLEKRRRQVMETLEIIEEEEVMLFELIKEGKI